MLLRQGITFREPSRFLDAAKSPVDAELSLTIDLMCALLGLPLMEHIYVGMQGSSFCVRERGLLKGTSALVRAIRERIAYLAKSERESGNENPGERRASRAVAAEPPEEPLGYRRGGPGKT
jgi:hypothetical protein